MADEPFDRSLASLALSLASKAGASYAEATLERSSIQDYSLKQGTLEGAFQGSFSGMRVRMIRGGYLYSMCAQHPNKAAVAKLFSKVDRFRKPGSQRLFQSDSSKAQYSVEEKMQPNPQDIMKELLGIDGEIGKVKDIKFRYANLSYSNTRRYYVSSTGSEIESSIPNVGIFFSIVVSGPSSTRQRILQNGATGGIEHIAGFEVASHAVEDAANMKKIMTDGTSAKPGIKRVVISPEIVGIAVHESIGHPLEADRVLGREAAQAGMSYLSTDNLGMQIGSKNVTIFDDPTLEHRSGYYLYDDEGIKARKRVMVRNGKQVELLHNMETATAFDTTSNGSARSSGVSVEPLVRMANTYLEPDRSNRLEDLIEEAKDGIYIKSFTEWNIDDTRSFSKYQGNEAYLIKNGRIDKPVRNFSLESKTVDFWGAVEMVDDEFEMTVGNCGKGEPMQGVPVSMGGPSALLVFR